MKLHFTSIRTSLRAFIVAGSLLLTACFGTGAAIIASGGIGGTGMSLGPILLFGSIWVNGVEYDTSKADIYVEGSLVATGDTFIQDHLAVGQVVRVEGTNNGDGTGTADRVYFNDNVEGPIAGFNQIDTVTAEFTVMGQPVIANDQTKYAGMATSIADLQDNYLVEISGLVDQNGIIRATYINMKDVTYSTTDEYELKGVVSSQSGGSTIGTIMINNLMINYDASTNLSDSDLAAIGGITSVVGHLVEVKGTFNGTSMDATKIELETEIEGDDGDEVEVQGYVTDTSNLASNQFTLGYQVVEFDASTEFKGGLPTDIALDTHLEVEGTLQGGILIADEIAFEDESEVTSTIATYDDSAEPRILTMSGLLGVAVHVNQLTEINGSTNSLTALDTLWSGKGTDDVLADIRGRWDGSVLIATDIETQYTNNPEEDAELQGPVASMSGAFIEIMDEFIDTTGIEYELNDSTVSQTEFFSTIKVGDIVKLEGKLDTGSGDITWEKMELENDE